MTEIRRPERSEYAAFYAAYVDEMPEGPILELLAAQGAECQDLLASLDDQRGRFRYAPGKWSVKEVVGHLGDSERVFAYRALAIARGEQTALPGFDENEYVAAADFDSIPLSTLAAGLRHVRAASLALFGSLNEQEIGRRGTANDSAVTVRALAWILAGHERHHLAVLRERYGL